MRVANYYRVSTELQEKKFSLSAQKEELHSYGINQGWNLVGEYKDVESGGKLKKDGLNDLLDLVEEGGVDVVLVVDQDRLSRLDTVAWEYLKSTLRDNNVKIAEPGNIIDLSNEDDEFISDIKNLIAKREKKAIVRRMMRGKRQRLREGKGWGMPPFEYTYNKNTAKYEVKKDWKWVIPFIDNLYLNEQLGMKTISDKLNEISPTPTNKPWNEHLIYTRLTSKAFHGVSEKIFDSGEVISIDGIYEPLRTEETYKKLQEERNNRGKQFSVAGRKNVKTIHMLKRTYLSCGICGSKLGIPSHGTKKRPVYYIKHGRKKRISDGHICDISINTARVDQNIIQALKDVLTNEEMAKKYINIEYDEHEVEELKNIIDETKNTIMELNSSLDRLLDLYLSGGLNKDKYTEKEKLITSKIELHKDILDQNERKLNAIDTKSFTYETLLHYLEIVQDIDTKLTGLERAQLMGSLFPTGTVYSNKLVLVTKVYNGIPIEINIPIDADPHTWHHTKHISVDNG